MTYLALHVALAAVLLFLRCRRRPAPLGLSRVALVASLAAPLLIARVPAARWTGAPAQVWAGVAAGGGGARAVLQVRTTAMPAAAGLPDALLLALVALVAAVLARHALALRRKLRAAVVVRRIGRVRIAVSGEGPWSAALGRTGWVVLDRATAADARLRRLALLHELQHLRQGDALWAWLLAALQPAFLWSPLARMARAGLVECEELACDAAVVRRGRVGARPYAGALLEVAERGLEVALPASPALHGHSLLHRRIDMLLSPRPRRPFADALLLAATLLAACAGARAVDSAVVDHRVDAVRAREAAQRASGPEFPVVANDVVLGQLNGLVARPAGLAFARAALGRRPQQLPAIQAALAAQGLPPQLDAVAFIESGYQNVDAGEHGAGLWQFIVPTAQHYGLEVSAARDQRMDPAAEAAAAARYLGDLHRQFGDWPLALAAYTQGEAFVSRAVERERTRDAWELIRRGALDPYPAKVMAAAMVIADPSLAGR